MVGPIERKYIPGDGTEVHVLDAFWLTLVKRDGTTDPGFRIDPDYLVGEKRSVAGIVRGLLEAEKSAVQT